MVAAMANDRVIGKNNQMPWHLPADFAWFKRVTMGCPIIMGRKTFESIGRPLPGRRNIVISRDSSYRADGIEVVSGIEHAKSLAGDVKELMVIGGGSVYEACLPIADRLYLTFIDADIDGDTCFPKWDSEWHKVSSESFKADDKNAYDMEFTVWERKH